MTKSSALLLSILLSSSSALAAESSCPSFEPGESYPWQTSEIMPGDEWANLYIDLDEKARPTNCKIGKSKLRKETGFWMCRAMMAQGNFEPVMKDGIPVKGTVTRYMFLAGRTHRQADEAARKKFFKEHPEERPGCYPE